MLTWLVRIQQVFAFGCNSSGQLGLGDFQDRRAPCEVPGLWALPVVSLSAGDEHSTALTANGFLFAWGGNDRGQLGLPKNADAAERVWATPISLHVSEESCSLHGQLNICGAHVGAGGVSQEVLYVWCPGARVPCTKGRASAPPRHVSKVERSSRWELDGGHGVTGAVRLRRCSGRQVSGGGRGGRLTSAF